MSILRALVIVLACAGVCGCAPFRAPAPGTSQDAVLREWGQPTARYTLAEGVTRLEYATGPMGRTTWMIDLDAQGRVRQGRQVLNEGDFLAVQQTLDLTRDGLLQRLGTPGERRGGGRQGGQVWSWRYPNNDCLWFQSSVADDGRVTSSSYGNDPMCNTLDKD